ncbi:FliM/FliN family flagellar motor switch protein [Vibrio coralliilyticus]|uniref:FliM/FliN family flagellar motor switch protein n=1 Tax=Vibrio coralliilyticus TaxID=190893 RepID=A0AAP6ZKN2_9VIBR|nr:FliM/FliN family flagellar motor C-terminal domain-containing protein [Vibrio coralliilyticus]NOJ23555.1 FliM/FliN family flagellar motor switch protein [Vibrio coralliilyticus]
MKNNKFKGVKVDLEVSVGKLTTTLDNVMNIKTGDIIDSGIDLEERVSILLDGNTIAQGILVDKDGCFAVEITDVLG